MKPSFKEIIIISIAGHVPIDASRAAEVEAGFPALPVILHVAEGLNSGSGHRQSVVPDVSSGSVGKQHQVSG